MNCFSINSGKVKGICLIAFLSLISFGLSQISSLKALAISPLIIGILVGMLVANTVRERIPTAWDAGLKFSAKTILRAAITFFGFRLTLVDVAAVGWQGVAVDLLIIISVVLLGTILGKLIGLDRNLTLLTSSGSAICGAAAVLATEPILKDKPHKTVVAVSTVVIFGTIAMFVYPAMYRAGLLSSLTEHQVAVYTGSTLHEVAHVAGAGAAMDNPTIANLATITKMIRVILLAPFLLFLSSFVSQRADPGSTVKQITIPWFAIWFMVVIVLNTGLTYWTQQLGIIDNYRSVTKGIETLDTFALTMAMTALGCDAGFARFREAGFKPFLLALFLACWLMGFGYLLVFLFC
ncbi:MAG: YeiH family protein [Porphyromonas sp.]|nr:YeiH family protein [Porphyromonas sp.]